MKNENATEFELFYNQGFHSYGAVIRREGKEDEIYHHVATTKLKDMLSSYGLWPSFQIPKFALEAGARIIVKMPDQVKKQTTEDEDFRPLQLRKGAF